MKFKHGEVIAYYDKKYYHKNDGAHNIYHIRTVMDNALRGNVKLGFHQYENLVIMAVACHDIMCWKDRATHHELGADYVLKENDKYLSKLSASERLLISEAVRTHRASYKGERVTNLAKLLAVADKGKPILHDQLRRAYKYYNDNTPNASDLEKAKSVIEHMHDKFGRNGYAYENDPLYVNLYSEDIEVFITELDTLTPQEVLRIVKEK